MTVLSIYWTKSTGEYIVFHQRGPIDNCTHVPGPVAQSSAKSEYNEECTAGMDLEHLRMMNIELLNKDPDVVPEQEHIIILDNKSAVYIDKNSKDTKYNRHISIIMHFIRNGKE